MDLPLIQIEHVHKSYSIAAGTFDAITDVTLTIDSGQRVAITGKSGSGKSTLLNMISGIDRPTEGTIKVNGVHVDRLSESALAHWRGKNVGVVFQFFQLLPTLTVLENVMLPMDFAGIGSRKERRSRGQQLLEIVGILDQADKMPATLSGGQQQRCAIARSLANDPPLIIADEPTGNLDTATTSDIFRLFARLADDGKTVIVVTHEREFESYFDKIINIVDGKVIHQQQQSIYGNHAN